MASPLQLHRLGVEKQLPEASLQWREVRMEAGAYCAHRHLDLGGRQTPGRKETLHKWTDLNQETQPSILVLKAVALSGRSPTPSSTPLALGPGTPGMYPVWAACTLLLWLNCNYPRWAGAGLVLHLVVSNDLCHYCRHSGREDFFRTFC